MTPNTCDFLTRFIANPGGFHEEARGRADELLRHLTDCVHCQARIDEIGDENVAMLFELLAGAETTQSPNPEEDRRLDKILEADADRERDIRKAVQDNLISGFLTLSAAGKIARNFDPLILYSATEAVSMLIRRHRSLSPPTSFLELNQDGSLSTNEREAISSEEMATEIARFANLWETSESVSTESVSTAPIEQGRRLAEWTFLAAHERPNLFRDFRAVAPFSYRVETLSFRGMLRYMPGGIIKPQAPLQLIPLNPKDRIDDLNKRWRPLTADMPFIYGVLNRKQAELHPVPVLQFTTKEFFNVCSSYQRLAHSFLREGSHSEMTFFLLDKELGEVHAAQKTEIVVDSGYTASCTMIGTFSSVFFEGKGEVQIVEITGKRMSKYAPRVDVPVHLKYL
jgi:hypothetical protein